MKFDNITDIFFDLDHTLWDFDKNSSLAFQRVFLKHNIEVDFDTFIQNYEPINLKYWKLFREEKVSKTELRRGRLNDTFAILNLEYPVNEVDAIAVSYIEEMPLDNHLFENTVEVLQYLSSKYRLHIITNGFHDVQYLKLKNSDIYKYFKTITTSEEVNVKKPNPIIFEHALNKAKVNSVQSLMIGDSFEADILGADNVGMKTIHFNYKNISVPNKYHKIVNLFELTLLL